MVTYADSDDNAQSVIIDQKCMNVYNDVSQIYFNKTMQNKEDALYSLLTKYDKHYLVYYYIGYYYGKIGNIASAIACYKICISIYPLMDAYLNLGIIYQQLGKMDETKKILNIATQCNKDDVRILNFLGAIYYLEKDYYLAINHYKKILEEHPTPTSSLKNVYNNIGFSCSAIGKCEKALNYFEQGLQIKCSETPELTKLNVQLLQNKLINYDYMYDNPPTVFQEFLRINDLLKTVGICTRNKSSSGKIKIGYISPDLRQHVCAYFIEPILQYFDRSKFTVYCYANVMNEDAVSRKFKGFPEIRWFNIFDSPTSDVCQLIKSHEIDILIDLAGHTNGNRLDVMSQKPAPIQMTYLGYPNTTGLTSVDYRITDKYADPPSTKQKFSEKLIYMPRCFVNYTMAVKPEEIPVIPVKHDFITFGVMNKLNKHNKITFKAWSDIIKQVPNSILLIKRDMKSAFDIRIKYLKKLGLESNRIKIVNYVADQYEYYKLYNSIDICLDTFPYSGTTTSCDALQMSTPIITLGIPDRHVSNVTNSMLTNMGFPELIVNNIDDYVKAAVTLANDKDKIIYYKNNIRQKFIELMDGKKFSAEFDQLMINTFAKH